MRRRTPQSTLVPYTTLFRSVAPDRQRQPKGEDQPHQREKGALHDPDRLAQRLGLPAQHPAGEVPEEQESADDAGDRSEEHTSELQSLTNLVCRLLLEKKKRE